MKEKVLLAFSGGLDTSFCAMYLAKELTTSSLSTIGSRFGHYNHTTVLYAVKCVSDQRAVDKDFDNHVKELESRIKS